MSYRPKIKADASGTLTDLPLDASTLDGHSVESTGVSSNTTTLPTTAQVKSYVDGNFTKSSVIPNNSGEIKTKYRCSIKGYTGEGNPIWYYKLCTLPVNNAGNYASVIINGRIGGWVSSNMSSIYCLIWNRDTPGFALLDIGGTGVMSSIFGTCDLVLYVNSNNTATIYAKAKGYFTFDFDIETFQNSTTIDFDGTYITTTPSGTLTASASTTTSRLQLEQGVLKVNGTSVSLEGHTHSQYSTTDTKNTTGTTNKASTKMYLVGATEQSANPQTYSNSNCYIGTDNKLYSNGNAVITDISSKQDTITGGATTITSDNLTTNRALMSNASGKVAVSSVTSTELGYVSGVTSAIQTQINNVVNVASGKTKAYVTNKTQMSTLNSQNDSVTITTFKDKDGTTIATSNFAIGDIIYLTDTEIPDRWVGAKSTSGSTTTLTLYKMETSKVDLTSYLTNVKYANNKISYTKNGSDTDVVSVDTSATENSTNLITSGAVYSGLNDKAPKSHASSNTTYGIGTSSNYGHVKLGDADQNGTMASAGVVAPNGHTHSQYASKLISTVSLNTARTNNKIGFINKTWTGLTNFNGNDIWTDGENIYYSNGTNQYVLDIEKSTWIIKNWNGLTSFSGVDIWNDGTNIYYSSSSTQYVLDKSTNTWTTKTWTNLTNFDGKHIWTDGDNIYYSDSNNSGQQYVLDKSTNAWTTKTWTGLVNNNKLEGQYVWTDGKNICYSAYASGGYATYILDISTSKWSNFSMGNSDFTGDMVWSDGTNIYRSSVGNGTIYLLDKSTPSWKELYDSSSMNFKYVWSDGVNAYYSNGNTQYQLTNIDNNIDCKTTIKGCILSSQQQGFVQNEYDKTQNSNYGPIIHQKEVYPIGSIYMSVNSTSPASLFGGTWEQLKDKFLLGAGDTYSNGSTGGNATHSHTLENGYAKYNIRTTGSAYAVEKIVDAYTPNKRCENGDQFVNFNNWDITGAIQLGGSTDSGSSLPPYLTVYMWKRTA